MKHTKRFSALFLALLMALSLCACGGDKYTSFLKDGWDGGSEPTSAPEATTPVVPEDELTEPLTPEEAATNNGTKNTASTSKKIGSKTPTVKRASTTPTKAGTVKPTSGNQGTVKPTQSGGKTYTAAEALNLYKTAANKAKTQTNVTCTRTREVYTEVGEKNLSGLSGTIVGRAFEPKDDKSQKVLSSQSDIIKGFVVEKQNYVCNLGIDDIKSASAKQSGANTVVTIYVKDDTTDNQNYSNKAVSATAVADLASTFSSLTMRCRDVRITATIDANGRLINLNTYMPSYFTSGDQKFGAAIEQWWTISYS